MYGEFSDSESEEDPDYNINDSDEYEGSEFDDLD